MNLDRWQQRLEQHFASVANARAGTTWPVFALEHGLTNDELRALTDDIRTTIRNCQPSDRAWLPWVVYGAEHGYEYEGDEYWPSFERSTPGWIEHCDRHWLRHRFVRFAEKFRGAQPTGAWADTFTIICWPITHAILPRDLQQQLARLLDELRYAFTAEMLRKPEALGACIRAVSYGASRRFQYFAQDAHLVGHIASALLLHDAEQPRIVPSTLERIVRDLETQQAAREWLSRARQYARRIQFRGLGSPTRSMGTTDAGEDEEHVIAADVRPKRDVDAPSLEVEARLLLTKKSEDEWRLGVIVPDLTPLTYRFPQLRPALAEERCVVSGSAHPQARGAFLYGRRTVPLDKWPSTTEPLLRFDKQSAELTALIRLHLTIAPRTLRLFKIDDDATASEVPRLVVRPGAAYVLTTTAPRAPTLGRPVRIGLLNTHSVAFEIPVTPTTAELAIFTAAGLTVSKRIDVWPAGLPVGLWNGEGDCEWLAGEPLMLGIRADHPLRTVRAEIQGAACAPAAIDLTPPARGEATFLRLPDLSAGIAVCTFHAENETGESVDGSLRVIVREPRAPAPGRAANGLIHIATNPAAASLEQLWDGRADVEFHGPAGRVARTTLTLESGVPEPLAVKHLTPIALPTTARDWRVLFEREGRQDDRLQRAYDEAKRCRIDVVVDEVGNASLLLEREFTPMRWRLRVSRDTVTARLLNDAGAEVVVGRYRFDEPLALLPIDVDEGASFIAPADGGLLVARCGETERGVIAPPTVRTFQDLACHPRIEIAERSVYRVLDLLHAARRWGSAHLPGGLGAVIPQHAVLDAITRAIAHQFCGDEWLRLEDLFQRESSRERAAERLAEALAARADHHGIGRAFLRDLDTFVAESTRDRVQRFSGITKPALKGVWPNAVAGLAHPGEFVLRLFSDPCAFLTWAEHRADADLEHDLRGVLSFQVYARAARCLVLLVHRMLSPAPIRAGHLYEGWTWDSRN